MASLELREVSFAYPGSTRDALSGVTCRLETGRLTALVGANGCGKSSLAKVAAGLLTPRAGEVVVTGVPDYPAWNGVGLLFQNPDEQLLAADVAGELAWGLENLAVPPDRIARRVETALHDFGLAEMARQPPEALSDGWKQIVALAAVTVMEPAFLLLDEATAFLDPPSAMRIREMARKLSDHTGVLWISTSGEFAASADEVWLMSGGRIVEAGSPSEILKAELLEPIGVEPLNNEDATPLPPREPGGGEK